MITSLRKAKGFTLIEILIVVLIISIVTGVALLSVHHNENKRIEAFANEMKQLLQLAEEQAMLEPRVLGLSFHAQSFQFSNYDPLPKLKNNQWLQREDKILGMRTIPRGIEINVDIPNQGKDTEKETGHPQIVISTNGDVTPFTIYIGKKGQQPSYAIVGQADGVIINKSLL